MAEMHSSELSDRQGDGSFPGSTQFNTCTFHCDGLALKFWVNMLDSVVHVCDGGQPYGERRRAKHSQVAAHLPTYNCRGSRDKRVLNLSVWPSGSLCCALCFTLSALQRLVGMMYYALNEMSFTLNYLQWKIFVTCVNVLFLTCPGLGFS